MRIHDDLLTRDSLRLADCLEKLAERKGRLFPNAAHKLQSNK